MTIEELDFRWEIYQVVGWWLVGKLSRPIPQLFADNTLV